MAKQYIAKKDVAAWLKKLGDMGPVLVPVREGASVVYRAYGPEAEVELDDRPTCSPKEAVFPQTELLFRYRQAKDPENLDRTRVVVKKAEPQVPGIVFGPRPCGTRGVSIIDRVYKGEKTSDELYAFRREGALFVTIGCAKPGAACFCTSVGCGPDDTTGSDVLLQPVAEGFVATAVTEAGAKLLEAGSFEAAGDKEAEAQKVADEARAAMGEPMDFSKSVESLLARFDDTDFWEAQAAKCIHCGACTYLCPTCYCFNITDETAGLSGKRVRTWDNCMTNEFTLEGSGHNPRPTKAHRLKNRVGHKFSYYPELHEKLIACCGCGRCIERCPSGVDIRKIVLAAIEATETEATDGNN